MKSNQDCLFCQVAAGRVPSTRVYEDDQLLAFADVRPKAPVHLLVIPKKHALASVADMKVDQQPLIGQMVWRAKCLAEEKKIAAAGYRLIFNCRSHGGQEIDHIHLHVIGGKALGPMA